MRVSSATKPMLKAFSKLASSPQVKSAHSSIFKSDPISISMMAEKLAHLKHLAQGKTIIDCNSAEHNELKISYKTALKALTEEQKLTLANSGLQNMSWNSFRGNTLSEFKDDVQKVINDIFEKS